MSVLPPVNIFVVLDLNGSDQLRELKLFVKNFLCSDYKAKITCCNHFLCVGSVEMHCTCKVVFFFFNCFNLFSFRFECRTSTAFAVYFSQLPCDSA